MQAIEGSVAKSVYVLVTAMRGVLNQNTRTLHVHQDGAGEHQTVCGSTNHVPDRALRATSIEGELAESGVERCGSCFEDAGGY